MATADELLAALTNSDEADKVLVIDNDLRTITIPKSIKALGVESDDEVHRLQFRMPRMCGDVDLSAFNIRVNYMNAKREGDIYVVTDKKILSNSITFSWLVGRNALAYKGNVNFIVCLKESNASGDVLREFNTTVATLPVLEGLEVDPAYLEGELHDVLEQLLSLTVAKVAEVEAAGASQIAKVQQESSKQQDNIVEKGAQVLATIPAEYQTTAELADEGVRSKADAITRTVEGKHIEVNDASDDNLRGLKLFGKTTQVTTTGKNLFGGDALADKLVEVASATKDESAGTVMFSSVNVSEKVILENCFKENTRYTFIFNGRNSGAGSRALNLRYEYTDGMVVGNQYFDKADEFSCYVYTSEAGKTLKSLQGSYHSYGTILEYNKCGVFEGVLTEADFEPYCGGVPSPNPDYPQPLVSPGNSGSVGVSVAGKNLIPYPYATQTTKIYGVEITVNTDGTITLNGTATAGVWFPIASKISLPAGTYSVQVFPDNWDNSYGYAIWKGVGGHFVNFKDVLEETTICNLSVTLYEGATLNNVVLTPQIEVGSIFTEYEPYVGSTLTAATPNGLPGIPVESGGNHVDENGQQWICDEVDFERGVYVQRVGNVDMGTISWNHGTFSNNRQVFTTDGVTNIVKCKDTNVRINAMCELYRAATQAETWSHGHMAYHNLNEKTFDIVNNDYTDSASFKAAMSGVILLYELATPISTPLSAADLASFKAAKTATPYTQIFNDSDVEMEASYNADTEIYIDNKIAERTPRNSYVAPAIVEAKSGEVISLSDSSDDTVRGLKLFGKTTQFTTTGKNLCPPVKAGAYNGNNGAFLSQYTNDRCTEKISIVKGQSYTHSNNLGTLPNNIFLWDTDGTYIGKASKANTYVSEYNGYIAYEYGETDVQWVQLELGSTATAYEPYTGGMAAPNPDYPQELESAGQSGSIGVTVAGKNLLNVGETLTFTDKHGPIYQFIPKGTYRIKCGNSTNDKGNNPTLHFYGEAGDTVASKTLYADTNKDITFATDAVRFTIISDRDYSSSSGVTAAIEKLMLSLEDGEYEPYKGQTLTASTPNGLPGIPVTSGGNYTDSDGQQWICDEVDFTRGVYVQRIGEVVYTGDESGINYDTVKDTILTVVTNDVRTDSVVSHIACTHFAAADRTGYINIYGGVAVRTGGVGLAFGLDIGTTASEVPSADRVPMFKAFLKEQYDAGTPVTVKYVLATPIETPLTKAELAAYRAAALHTNYPNTTIFNDANAGQEVTYVADTKNWIKNQLGV